MRENNQTDFWTIWGLENPMGKNATLFSIPLSWGLNFARTRKKFFASLASLCMCVFEGILKCHLVQKSVIYSHGSRYCDEFQSKSRKISLVSYRTCKTSIIKNIPIVPFLSILFIFGRKIKPNVANQRRFCNRISSFFFVTKMLLLVSVCCQIRPKPSSGFSLFSALQTGISATVLSRIEESSIII